MDNDLPDGVEIVETDSAGRPVAIIHTASQNNRWYIRPVWTEIQTTQGKALAPVWDMSICLN